LLIETNPDLRSLSFRHCNTGLHVVDNRDRSFPVSPWLVALWHPVSRWIFERSSCNPRCQVLLSPFKRISE